jgi:hypothetical protein
VESISHTYTLYLSGIHFTHLYPISQYLVYYFHPHYVQIEIASVV